MYVYIRVLEAGDFQGNVGKGVVRTFHLSFAGVCSLYGEEEGQPLPACMGQEQELCGFKQSSLGRGARWGKRTLQASPPPECVLHMAKKPHNV